MNEQRRIPLFTPIPLSLNIMAWLWIVIGAVLGVLNLIFWGTPTSAMGVIPTVSCLFFGAGILLRRPEAHRGALFLSYLGFVFSGVWAIVFMVGAVRSGFSDMDSILYGLVMLALWFLLLWQVIVLRRPAVAALFEPDNPNRPTEAYFNRRAGNDMGDEGHDE